MTLIDLAYGAAAVVLGLFAFKLMWDSYLERRRFAKFLQMLKKEQEELDKMLKEKYPHLFRDR